MHNTWKALEAIAGKSQDAKQIVWAPQVFSISAHRCSHTFLRGTLGLIAPFRGHLGTDFTCPEFALSGPAVKAPALHKFWQFPWFGLTETTQLLFFFFLAQKSKKTWYNLGKLNKWSSLPAAEYSETSLIRMASVHTHKPGRLSSESSIPRAAWRLGFLRLHDTLGNSQCQSSADVRKEKQS